MNLNDRPITLGKDAPFTSITGACLVADPVSQGTDVQTVLRLEQLQKHIAEITAEVHP